MSNIVPFQDLQGMAHAIAASNLFGMKNIDQALALMLVAQAEGQHPATITQDYDIIQGKAARKTHSVLARFQSMGGTVEWHDLTEAVADATFAHKSGGKLRISWTIEQAKKAGLTGKDNWKNYPRAMLRARCIAEGIRAVYPAALGGMMVTEEAQDVAGDQAIPVEVKVIETEQRPALPAYPADKFAENLPKWWDQIAGGKSADHLIAMLQTKATFTSEQLKEIRNVPKDEVVDEADQQDTQGQGEGA